VSSRMHCNTATAVFEGIRGYWNADEQEMFLVRPVEHFERWKAKLRHPANWRRTQPRYVERDHRRNSCGAIDSGRTSTCAHWHTNQPSVLA